MKKKESIIDIPQLNINISKDDPNSNDFLYCWKEFGKRPNRITLYNNYSTKEFNSIISPLVVDRNVFTEVIPSDGDNVINDKMFIKINDGIYISYLSFDRNYENSSINEIVFFYDSEDNAVIIQQLIKELDSCLVGYGDEEGSYKINTINISQNGIEIEPIEISDIDIDKIELYYTTKTFNKVDKLIKSIKKSSKGLSLLYGPRGTGKTSIINYITTKIDRIVIFIPNSLIENTINNPEFRKFLKKYNKPVIVIDDCEMLYNDLFSKSNMFVNNTLQLVDGLISDSIEVNIIALFNVDDEDEIDHHLLECNNLLDIIEFSDLSESESCDLSNHLGHNRKYKNKSKLVDIIKNKKTKDLSSIGF